MASTVETHVLREGDYDDWSALVRRSAEGSVYGSPEYLDALCSATGGTFRILGARKGDELVGGAPLYEERSRGGPFVAPRLLLYYNGPVLAPATSRYPSVRASGAIRALDALARAIEGERYGRVTFKCRPSLADVRPFLARDWSARPTYSYAVALGDMDEAWARVEQNLRRLVRRSEEAGMRFSEDDDFDGFWALHERTMERRDKATYLPRAAFRAFFDRLHRQGLATLMHARNGEGRVVATSMVLLGDYPTAHTVSAAADEDAQKLGTNPFLRWSSFRALHEKGFRENDLTDATLNPVTRFKSQLGGELVHSMEVDAPRSLRYRAAEAGTSLRRKLRGRLGGLARNVLRRAGA